MELALALTAFLLSQIADIWSTIRGLKAGAREANPIIAWAMRNLGPWGWIVLKKR